MEGTNERRFLRRTYGRYTESNFNPIVALNNLWKDPAPSRPLNSTIHELFPLLLVFPNNSLDCN